MTAAAILGLAVACHLVACGSVQNRSTTLPTTASLPRLNSPVGSPVAPELSPSDRTGAGVAFDQNRRVLVLFGGFDTTSRGSLNDTWEWTPDASWTKRGPMLSPTSRTQAAMAYDPADRVVLLYGGANVQPDEPGAFVCNDFGTLYCSPETWKWDGRNWTSVHLDASPAVIGPVMAFDYSQTRMVMFGGSTHLWDGSAWSNPAATHPNYARIRPQMVFDPATRQMLLFGGFDYGGGDMSIMWRLTGDSWTALTVRAPLHGLLGAASTDTVDRGVLTYIDPDYQGTVASQTRVAPPQTWRWDGAQWSRLHPTHEPDLFPIGMFDDPIGHRVLMVGPGPGSEALQVWARSGTDWSQLA